LATEGDLHIEDGRILIFGDGLWVDLHAVEPFQEWSEEHPRLWFALRHLPIEVADSFLGSIHHGNLTDADKDDLWEWADDIEAVTRAKAAGSFRPPPAIGTRQEWLATLLSFSAEGKFVRAKFRSEFGWGGYFESRTPADMTLIHDHIGKIVRVVGRVSRSVAEIRVELDGRVRVFAR